MTMAMHNVHAEAVALQERMSNRPVVGVKKRGRAIVLVGAFGVIWMGRNSMLVDHAVLPADDKPGADATLVIRNDAGDAACW